MWVRNTWAITVRLLRYSEILYLEIPLRFRLLIDLVRAQNLILRNDVRQRTYLNLVVWLCLQIYFFIRTYLWHFQVLSRCVGFDISSWACYVSTIVIQATLRWNYLSRRPDRLNSCWLSGLLLVLFINLRVDQKLCFHNVVCSSICIFTQNAALSSTLVCGIRHFWTHCRGATNNLSNHIVVWGQSWWDWACTRSWALHQFSSLLSIFCCVWTTIGRLLLSLTTNLLELGDRLARSIEEIFANLTMHIQERLFLRWEHPLRRLLSSQSCLTSRWLAAAFQCNVVINEIRHRWNLHNCGLR